MSLSNVDFRALGTPAGRIDSGDHHRFAADSAHEQRYVRGAIAVLFALVGAKLLLQR